MGVPSDVNPRGLPWPSLSGDIDYLKNVTKKDVIILGRRSLIIAGKFLKSDGRSVIGVSTTSYLSDEHKILPSIEEAVRHAENWSSDKDIWFGGGATLAGAAFKLLEAEGVGDFHETVIDADYPHATVYMPAFDDDKWTEPETVAEFPVGFTDKGRRTESGIWLPEPTPPYRIQVRRIK